jgi:NAD(P)-dependent dehydrogenase (short-subunit alcohol dehydrogenase family)
VLVARGRNAGERLAREVRGTFVRGPVEEPETAETVMEAASELGGLDVLVNNAGIDHVHELVTAAPAEVRRVLEVNFLGACWFLQAAARSMGSRGGAIVNVTSRLASIGIPEMAIYAASKGALLALSRAAAVELAPQGIRINAVAPGFTATPLFEMWLSEQPDRNAALQSALRGIPQGRLGSPEEVAATVAFLASDESAHITGASIPVDGGYTAT